ncbi:IclR family transcriptional regulator [Actinomadura livida]|uniref:IclR family transcriptional regulator n=1 Tax=Actinomadura livida TaxID=79909 RepID=A0A7W7I8U2_9ACTN|nr:MULTISPECIES: IclR family transcriptional regulator [Actinomadura]MBB4772646.1 DNA-binding IclR family transcriptional regulator [Actinomadura catellatispora]GGU11856.1 IclR family transcriptional regulator [Actinomadura livida]
MSDRSRNPGASAAANAGANAGTEVAGRVADVLLLFAGGPRSLGVSAISRELGVSKAVVHRILRSLVSREMLEDDPGTGRYRLGSAAVALGVSALRGSNVRDAAAPVLRRLRNETGETTTLSGLVGDERVYLDQFESPHEVRMTVEVGRRFPLHAGSSGKAILAFLPEERREAVLARPRAALTARTVTGAAELRGELAAIAAEGTAVSLGERLPDAASVAAPLPGPDGAVHGSISVCGPLHRFTPEEIDRYRGLVRAAAAEIVRARDAALA